MLTSDFTGAYDYEREEAINSFEHFMLYRSEYTDKEQCEEVEKEQVYWQKILEPEGFEDFCRAWNECAMREKLGLHLCMVSPVNPTADMFL